MKQILVGTTSHGKFAEFLRLINGLGMEAIHPEVIGKTLEDFPEVGSSFLEISHKKALAWGEWSKKPVLVDDSGLTILALDGKPGIFSKRVKDGSDLERNLHILKSLKDIPQDKRQAAFVCALTFYDLEKQIVIQTQGIVAGRIASKIAGEEGFGYDSIFIPDGYQETFAQLGTKEKNKFSHRANATFSMRPFLQQWSHEN